MALLLPWSARRRRSSRACLVGMRNSRITPAEIDTIEDATYALDAMCLDAVQHVIDRDLFELFGVEHGKVLNVQAAAGGPGPSRAESPTA